MKSIQAAETVPDKSGELGGSQFPAVRYFQIHFQHMETQLTEALQKMETLQHQVNELQMRLARKERVESIAGRPRSPVREEAGDRFWRNE